MFNTGIVLQNCSIMPDVEMKSYLQTAKTYLTRPSKPFSTAVFLNNYIDGVVQRDRYMIWNKTQPNTEHSYFDEFGNIEPGVNTTIR
ncbi:pectinesterase 4-like protein, partial [Trifolium pratense]